MPFMESVSTIAESRSDQPEALWRPPQSSLCAKKKSEAHRGPLNGLTRLYLDHSSQSGVYYANKPDPEIFTVKYFVFYGFFSQWQVRLLHHVLAEFRRIQGFA